MFDDQMNRDAAFKGYEGPWTLRKADSPKPTEEAAALAHQGRGATGVAGGRGVKCAGEESGLAGAAAFSDDDIVPAPAPAPAAARRRVRVAAIAAAARPRGAAPRRRRAGAERAAGGTGRAAVPRRGAGGRARDEGGARAARALDATAPATAPAAAPAPAKARVPPIGGAEAAARPAGRRPAPRPRRRGRRGTTRGSPRRGGAQQAAVDRAVRAQVEPAKPAAATPAKPPPQLPPRSRAHMTPRTVDRKKQSARADVEARTLKVSWPDFAPRPSDDDLKRTFSEFGAVVHCGVGTKKKSGLVVFGKAEDCAAAARGYRGPMDVQRSAT